MTTRKKKFILHAAFHMNNWLWCYKVPIQNSLLVLSERKSDRKVLKYGPLAQLVRAYDS
jgi:hypothetical protein